MRRRSLSGMAPVAFVQGEVEECGGGLPGARGPFVVESEDAVEGEGDEGEGTGRCEESVGRVVRNAPEQQRG